MGIPSKGPRRSITHPQDSKNLTINMKAMIVIATLAALVACTLATSTCYVCDSGSNSDCSDPFTSDSIGSSSSYCQKTKVTVGGASTVARTCSSSCTEGSVSIFGIKTTTKCCTSDLCNSAPATSTSLVAMCIPVIASVAKYYF